MSSNLVNGIFQVLTSNVLERFSASLGLDKAKVESAVRAGVPALLAALSSLASRVGGAAALQEALSRQPADLLSNITGAVGGAGQGKLIEATNSDLTSLLGTKTTSAISKAVAKYAGLGNGESQTVMGLLGSAVMAVLGQQQRANDLDSTAVADLLASQSDDISRAMPAGLAKYLGGIGLPGSIAEGEETRASPAYPDAEAPKYAAPAMKSSATQWGWLFPVLALGVLLGLWQLSSGPDERRADISPSAPAATDTSRTAAAAPEATDTAATSGASTGETGLEPVQATNFQALDRLRGIRVGSVDLGQQSTSAVNALRSSLVTITDGASAEAALPPLKRSAGEFDGISGLANELSLDNRDALAKAIAAVRPTLDQLCEKALLVPGASAIIKPTIDDIRAKLDTLAMSRAS